MRALVTGGAGFIGSHIADALIALGHQVTIIDNLSTGRLENIPQGAEFFELDIGSPEVEDVFERGQFDLVFHHAAQIDVRVSVRDPLADLRTNIAGSVALLEWCRRYGVGRFVFASTGGAIYGEQEAFPAAEDHPTRPVSPYGVTKLAVERYMYVYHLEYGLNATALRYANVYGPRQNPFGEAGVVAIFCRKMLDGEQAYINGDGTQTRDYVYVDDVVRANALALNMEGFHILNIGTGRETDVLTIFDALNRQSGADLPRKHRPEPPGEQQRSSIDPGRALEVLGWRSEVELERGMKLTLEYFRRH